MEYDRYAWDPRWIDDAPLSAALTPEDVRDTAQRSLDPARYVQVTLVPEATAAPED